MIDAPKHLFQAQICSQEYFNREIRKATDKITNIYASQNLDIPENTEKPATKRDA